MRRTRRIGIHLLCLHDRVRTGRLDEQRIGIGLGDYRNRFGMTRMCTSSGRFFSMSAISAAVAVNLSTPLPQGVCRPTSRLARSAFKPTHVNYAASKFAEWHTKLRSRWGGMTSVIAGRTVEGEAAAHAIKTQCTAAGACTFLYS